MVVEIQSNSKRSESIKFLCSYGGNILPRSTDGKLRYVGGLTRLLSVNRSISFTDLMLKLVQFCGYSVTLRCQLPNGDLDTLISIKSLDDLNSIIAEYDEAPLISNSATPSKIRAILSPPKSLKQITPPLSDTPNSLKQIAPPLSDTPNSLNQITPPLSDTPNSLNQITPPLSDSSSSGSSSPVKYRFFRRNFSPTPSMAYPLRPCYCRSCYLQQNPRVFLNAPCSNCFFR